MKKIFLCAVAGGAVFVLLYNFLKLNIYISIGAALAAYFAMTLILSDRNISNEKDLRLENIENAAVIIKKCSSYIKSIKKTASAVNNKELSAGIYDICGTFDKILSYNSNIKNYRQGCDEDIERYRQRNENKLEALNIYLKEAEKQSSEIKTNKLAEAQKAIDKENAELQRTLDVSQKNFEQNKNQIVQELFDELFA